MSIRIDANTDRVYRDASLPTVDAWTVCAWAYGLTLTGAAGQLLWTNPTSGNQSVSVNAVGNVQLTTPALATTTIVAWSVNAWQFVAMRQLNGNHAGFVVSVDGTVSSLERAFTPSGTIGQMSWGKNSASAYVNCRLAGLKLWDVGLSLDEILNERWSLLPRRLDGLNEFWPCFPGATERGAGYSKARNLIQDGTLTDEDPPPVGWGASPIIISAAAAAGAAYAQAKYRFYLDDGVTL